MSAHEIEVILTRQLASYLALPIFLVDPAGTLLYDNEPAEALLGLRFEESGEMPASEWATRFTPVDATGQPLAPEALPLMIALTERRPGLPPPWDPRSQRPRPPARRDRLPPHRPSRPFLGAVALFWETPPADEAGR